MTVTCRRPLASPRVGIRLRFPTRASRNLRSEPLPTCLLVIKRNEPARTITIMVRWLRNNLDLKKEAFVGLQISIRRSGEVSIADLRGRSTVNDGESEVLSRQLQKLVADGVRKLLLNLAELTQIDSSGVSIIAETYLNLKRRGGRLKLLCPSGRVLQVLTVFRLLHVIESFEDEALALASFQHLEAGLWKPENTETPSLL